MVSTEKRRMICLAFAEHFVAAVVVGLVVLGVVSVAVVFAVVGELAELGALRSALGCK